MTVTPSGPVELRVRGGAGPEDLAAILAVLTRCSAPGATAGSGRDARYTAWRATRRTALDGRRQA